MNAAPQVETDWSPEQVATLLQLHRERWTYGTIAWELGRSAEAVKSKLRDIRRAKEAGRPLNARPPRKARASQGARHIRKTERAARTCLCCQKQFASEGIGNRVCVPCKKSVAWE